ncbi:MAG TPA: threonine--tRNA ligase [Candidatus Binatia bacterium]|nr:threonine--tRNA ligase [Candidatus Binatia bacterium]
MSASVQHVTVTLPGGEKRSVPAGSSPREILPHAAQAIAAKVNGKVVDLSRPVTVDCEIEPITPSSAEGLEVLRHSSAHLMAQAVKRLFPDVQITIGPVIENGFYYDFKHERAFTPEDLERIEAEMKKIVAEHLTVTREEVPRDDAVRLFRDMGEHYKAEIIAGIPADETISLYRQGEFVDLCRGPHVPSTGRISAFKLTGVAGAYWRGDERNEMLQRIYGTAFASEKELRQHLALLEEAKRRDHRRLGKELDLFSFHPLAPGSPFFHPKGAFIYNELIAYIRRLYQRYGYQEVVTPQIFDVELWHRSGHMENYKENIFFTEIEGRDFGVKPMNCPGHILLYSAKKHSYRDLPLRYADFARLHRFERSGVLSGLTRVRSFAQDDAHIFCTPEQIESEVSGVLRMVSEVYHAFAFEEVRFDLSTRPPKRLGDDAIWDQAEAALAAALMKNEIPYRINAGDGAFYGPKIDIIVLDALRRAWQVATIQLDFMLPERFDLTYVTAEGSEARPVMIHRAVLGSIERFLGVLIEHCGGNFPLWLAPVQVKILTVTDSQDAYARQVHEQFLRAGLRSELDLRNEKLGYKIREAEVQKVPYMIVIGDKEVSTATVSPRGRKGEKISPLSVEEFIARLDAERVPGGAP